MCCWIISEIWTSSFDFTRSLSNLPQTVLEICRLVAFSLHSGITNSLIFLYFFHKHLPSLLVMLIGLQKEPFPLPLFQYVHLNEKIDLNCFKSWLISSHFVIPSAKLKSEFSSSMPPSVYVMREPFVTLINVLESVCSLHLSFE